MENITKKVKEIMPYQSSTTWGNLFKASTSHSHVVAPPLSPALAVAPAVPELLSGGVDSNPTLILSDFCGGSVSKKNFIKSPLFIQRPRRGDSNNT